MNFGKLFKIFKEAAPVLIPAVGAVIHAVGAVKDATKKHSDVPTPSTLTPPRFGGE